MRRASLVCATVMAIGCGGGGGTGTGSSTTTSETSGGTTTGTTESSGGPTTGAPTTGAPGLPGACESPIEAVLSTSARLEVDAGGRLRDALGRDVQLRGVNTGGRSKWAPFVPFPIDAEAELADVEAAAEMFFARLPGWGINVVRLLFSWEALEPSPGQYDMRYLDRYAAMVEAAWGQGLRVIVDFHQDIYSSAFCGDGFPPWTLAALPDPPHVCPDAGWGLKYVTDPDVRAAFDAFWADENAVQAAFFAMWAVMIERVGDHPGVLGFEIVNEPGWGTADIPTWKHETLNPFHTKAVAEMRAVGGDEPLIFFNNPGFEALGIDPVEHVRPEGSNLVYAPHMYDAGLIMGMTSFGMMPEPFLDDIADYAAAEGLAVLIGEFGYGHGAVGGEEWLDRALDHLDARRLGATLWECSQNEALWNEEDLSVLTPEGAERPALDVFVRPYLRAVAGAESAFAWDGTTATATWTAAEGVTEIALPTRRFAAATLAVELTTLSGPEGACFTLDQAGGELRVQAPAGARVEVRVTAG